MGPNRNLLAQAAEAKGPEIIGATIDPDDVITVRRNIGINKDRRPELHSLLCQTVYP